MQILKLLIVEGNTEKENLNFNNAGCVSQSENFSESIRTTHQKTIRKPPGTIRKPVETNRKRLT